MDILESLSGNLGGSEESTPSSEGNAAPSDGGSRRANDIGLDDVDGEKLMRAVETLLTAIGGKSGGGADAVAIANDMLGEPNGRQDEEKATQ